MNNGVPIVHLHVANFPAAVEIAKDCTLKSRPFVIANRISGRSIVQALSAQAEQAGIVPGLSVTRAQQFEKNLLVIPPDPLGYLQAQKLMQRLAQHYTPLVQDDGLGHLFLDLQGTSRLFGPHLDCAIRLRSEISEALNLIPTVGLATNKLVAKVATRVIGSAGIASVPDGEESSFLAPQDAQLLPGVGKSILRTLQTVGLRSIGSIATLPDLETLSLFGPRGFTLRESARGHDRSKVEPGELAKRTFSHRITFAETLYELPVLEAALIGAVEKLGLLLRQANLTTSRLSVELCYSDGVNTQASVGLPTPLFLDTHLVPQALSVMQRAYSRRLRVRSLRLIFGALEPACGEQDLFSVDQTSALTKLQLAIDKSRLRFGDKAVALASSLLYE